MTRALLTFALVMVLCSCGIRRPLIRPSDIPAYEEQQRKKREKLQREQAASPDVEDPEDSIFDHLVP